MRTWVFGYGSLLWNPGFEYVQCQLATLSGYHRSFCMRSIHHRGTPEAPGLVLALDEQADALCHGMALLVPAARRQQTLSYLRERELVSSAYVEKTLLIVLADGSTVSALTYVVDPDHVQYCGARPHSSLPTWVFVMQIYRGFRRVSQLWQDNSLA